MIKLIVPEYCQGCTDFDPQVTRRPVEINTSNYNTYFYGDTIVKCKYRNRCEDIYNYFKNEEN